MTERTALTVLLSETYVESFLNKPATPPHETLRDWIDQRVPSELSFDSVVGLLLLCSFVKATATTNAIVLNDTTGIATQFLTKTAERLNIVVLTNSGSENTLVYNTYQDERVVPIRYSLFAPQAISHNGVFLVCNWLKLEEIQNLADWLVDGTQIVFSTSTTQPNVHSVFDVLEACVGSFDVEACDTMKINDNEIYTVYAVVHKNKQRYTESRLTTVFQYAHSHNQIN